MAWYEDRFDNSDSFFIYAGPKKKHGFGGTPILGLHGLTHGNSHPMAWPLISDIRVFQNQGGGFRSTSAPAAPVSHESIPSNLLQLQSSSQPALLNQEVWKCHIWNQWTNRSDSDTVKRPVGRRAAGTNFRALGCTLTLCHPQTSTSGWLNQSSTTEADRDHFSHRNSHFMWAMGRIESNLGLDYVPV